LIWAQMTISLRKFVLLTEMVKLTPNLCFAMHGKHKYIIGTLNNNNNKYIVLKCFRIMNYIIKIPIL